MVRRHQQRQERLAAPSVAAYGQRPQRFAVITLPTRNKMTPRRLPRCNEVLPRQLKRRLDGFRSARHKINMIQIARRALLQKVGQVFSDLSGEERRMRVRHLVQLIFDCLNDHGMPMTHTGNRSEEIRVGKECVRTDRLWWSLKL